MAGKDNRKREMIPSHLALIPDGNRRWAKEHILEVQNSYQKGINKFIDFSIWAKQFGVKTLSVWALSTDNIKNRSKLEINLLYKLYVNACRNPQILKKLQDNKSRINFIGNPNLIPKTVREALQSLEEKTKMYEEFTVNILLGYGGRDDVMHAFKNIYDLALSGKSVDITEELLAKNIRTATLPDVDFIIRTSGENRLSGFLPWQSDYSELYFAKKYWPDFEKKDLKKALKVFSERQRRFGGGARIASRPAMP
jgi:undecaprenyl diphosphate synthase